MERAIFLDNSLIWYLKDRLESIRMPKYLTYFTSDIACLLIRRETLALGLLTGEKITKLVFEMLRERRFKVSYW